MAAPTPDSYSEAQRFHLSNQFRQNLESDTREKQTTRLQQNLQMLPHPDARLPVGTAARREERGQRNARQSRQNQLDALLQLVLRQRAVSHAALQVESKNS